MGPRIETGIKGMDELLGGGFIPGTSVLVVGPPGSGKSTYVRDLLVRASKKKVPSIHVTTNVPPGHFVELLHERGDGPVKIVDAYSWQEGKSGPDIVKSLTDLNDLKEKITAALGEDKGALITFDSLTDLLMKNEPTSVCKFVQLFTGLVKSKDSLALVCLEAGIHEPCAENMMNYLTDGTIEMKAEDEQRLIRVRRMNGTLHPLTWAPFVIGDKTIEVKAGEGPRKKGGVV